MSLTAGHRRNLHGVPSGFDGEAPRSVGIAELVARPPFDERLWQFRYQHRLDGLDRLGCVQLGPRHGKLLVINNYLGLDLTERDLSPRAGVGLGPERAIRLAWKQALGHVAGTPFVACLEPLHAAVLQSQHLLHVRNNSLQSLGLGQHVSLGTAQTVEVGQQFLLCLQSAVRQGAVGWTGILAGLCVEQVIPDTFNWHCHSPSPTVAGRPRTHLQARRTGPWWPLSDSPPFALRYWSAVKTPP